MQRLVPGDPVATEVEFSTELYAWPQSAMDKSQVWIRCNMVMSQDGAAVDKDGRSGTIATAIDKAVFGALRRDSDVILVGAGTVRIEGYRPTSVPIALVSRSLVLHQDLPLFAQATAQTPRTLVLTTERAMRAAPDWLSAKAELIACGADSVDLILARQALADRGLTRVHSEGGPALLTAMIAEQVLDELLLTVSPMIHGATRGILDSLASPVRGSFSQVLVEDGTLLLRFLPDYS